MGMFSEAPPTGPRPVPRREADALVSAALLEATRQAAAASTELLAILRGGGLVNGILETTTRKLDADGELPLSWRVPAGSAAVTNHSTSPIYVTNGATGATSGRGTARIAAGASAVVYLAHTDLTITGTPGAEVTVTAFTGVVSPSWGNPGGGGGGGQVIAAEATRTAVAASVTPVTLAAANPARVGISVLNDSSATLYIGLGDADVTTSDATAILPGSMAYFEAPAGFVGRLSGVWSSATGTAHVTEMI